MINYCRSCSMALCCALFCLLYVVQKVTPSLLHASGTRGEYGLLLFIVPGIISIHMAKGYRMLSTLASAVIAAAVCLLYQRFFISNQKDLWHDMAYVASAVFWCMFGAAVWLFVYFVRERAKVEQKAQQ
ncbi:MAG: inner membrane protein YbjM [Enterobacteriaceae bacterium]